MSEAYPSSRRRPGSRGVKNAGASAALQLPRQLSPDEIPAFAGMTITHRAFARTTR
jgi:hypothetical protein